MHRGNSFSSKIDLTKTRYLLTPLLLCQDEAPCSRHENNNQCCPNRK